MILSRSRRSFVLLLRSAAFLALLAALTACCTPRQRARRLAPAFHKLAPADQKLVLHGRIRPGLNKDAVYIAWGHPDWRREGGKGRESFEEWIYFSRLTNYAPMGSYDQSNMGAASLYHTGGPPWIEPGFGYGGFGNEGFLYPSHVIVTSTRLKRAVFTNGKVQEFEVRRGGRWLWPTLPGF